MSSSRSSTPSLHDPTPPVSSSPSHVGQAKTQLPHNASSPTDSASGSPPRKRQRTRTLDEQGMFPAGCTCHEHSITFETGPTLSEPSTSGHGEGSSEHSDPSLRRDERFYIPDADCVIRVENTLFRVHKFLLARDSSAFQDLFTLPSDQSSNDKSSLHSKHEGSTDSNPITLYGDTVKEFQVLLDLLYSMPPELQVYQTAAAPVPQLLTLTSILNKYHFATTSTWALTALYNVLSGKHGRPPPEYDINNPMCPEPLLEKIVEIACLCGYDELRDFIEDNWSTRIFGTGGPLSGLDARRREREARWAVHVSDKWGLKRLSGFAYYTLLLETAGRFNPAFTLGSPPSGNDSNEGTDNEPQSPAGVSNDPPPLTQPQTVRLLVGHMSLINAWDQIRLNTPTFQRPEGCVFHVHGCLAAWSATWREVSRSEATLNKFRSCDILGRLKIMEDQIIGNTDLQCALTPTCRRRAVHAVTELRSNILMNLADHFKDLTSE